MCVKKDIGELFLDKPDDLVLAFDTLCQRVMAWQPNTVGASVHSIVFTSKKAWLIVKPMKKDLDVKFYCDQPVDSVLIRRSSKMGKKHAHHVRLHNEFQITKELLDLLRIGYDFSLT
ncbi:MAG: hypothetical protein Roseis2KO_51880 [Roseivirga sp.]